MSVHTGPNGLSETTFETSRAKSEKAQITEQRNTISVAPARDLNYASFSGCDISVLAYAGGRLKKFAEMMTFSYSVHREKYPVRVCGLSNPKGYTRGTRTIAGSMIFTVFDRNAFWDILTKNPRDLPDRRSETPLIDAIPPIDLTISFTNEFGYHSRMTIYGAELVDHGMTMSVDDIITEQVVSYTARDITEMAPPGGEHGPDGGLNSGSAVFFSGYPSDIEVHRYYGALRELWKLNQKLLTTKQRQEGLDAADAQYLEVYNSLELDIRSLETKIENIKKSINSDMLDDYNRLASTDEHGRFRADYNAGASPIAPRWTYNDIR